MVVKGLSHVCLTAHDLDKTQAFYCDLLGCRVVHEFRNAQGQRYGLFLVINQGTFLEFFLEQAPTPPGGRFRHLCFEVEDIHQCAQRLRAAGCTVEVVRGRTDRVLQCWIHDPDGNQVEFHQYDPQAAQYPYVAAAA